jgi:hypothetical protein
LAIVSILFSASVSLAYETDTHDAITAAAFDRSVLAQGHLAQQLALPIEAGFRASDGQLFNARDWLRQGSIREDDIDLFRAPFRFRHHFYDPVYDRGLTGKLNGPVPVGRRAFEWALEETEEIPGQNFSWRDGRRYFLTALTAGPPSDRQAAMASTFLTLGHVIHLIQDMGVPEHTRNDWHAGVIPPLFPFGTPSLFEEQVNEGRTTFTYSGYSSPQFQQLRHFWVTGDGRGLSEFTNRNFVSKDTNFSEVMNGNTGRDNFGNIYPRPSLDLSLRDVDVTAADAPPCAAAAGLSGKVTFFGNQVDDRVTGEVLSNPFLTTYSLFDNALKTKGQPGLFSLNFCTIEAAAGMLLPRATAYSAALVDYFFRGKLDLGFGVDPGDATRSVITLANRSQETLGPGTIQLYADTLAGTRTKIAETGVGVTAKDQPLPALSIAREQEAQVLTAVYEGTLGKEPGAVIGKVGGRTVEQLFKGAADWMLRTPDGIFPLGLGTAPGRVKWGDSDNMLLAQTFLPANDMEFQAYRINRPEGSSAVPLKPNPLNPEAKVVDLAPVGPRIRLGATPLDLGTTVRYRRTHNYQQDLLSLRVKQELSIGEGSDLGILTLERLEVLSAGSTVAFANAFAINETFVPRTELPFFSNSRPYNWSLGEPFLSRDGDLLALVDVRPNQRLIFVPVYAHNEEGVIGPMTSSRAVSLFSPSIQILYFLVNLSQQKVVAKTSEDSVDLTFTTEGRFHETDALVSDFENQDNAAWVYPYNPAFSAGATFEGDPPVVATVTQVVGSSQFTVSGLHRRELVDAGFVVDFSIVRQDGTSITKIPGGRKQTGAVAAIQTLTTVFDIPPPAPLGIWEVRRASATDNTFAILGWMDVQNTERWVPFLWHSSRAAVTRLAGLDIPTDLESSVSLLSANAESAMLLATVTTQPDRIQQRTVRLTSAEQELTFVDRIDTRHRLLQPYWLFNVEDLRFHRVSAELEPLEGPRPLAVGGPTAGEYHVTGRGSP